MCRHFRYITVYPLRRASGAFPLAGGGDLLVIKNSKSIIRIIQKYSYMIVRLGREIGTFAHSRFFWFPSLISFVPTFFFNHLFIVFFFAFPPPLTHIPLRVFRSPHAGKECLARSPVLNSFKNIFATKHNKKMGGRERLLKKKSKPPFLVFTSIHPHKHITNSTLVPAPLPTAKLIDISPFRTVNFFFSLS